VRRGEALQYAKLMLEEALEQRAPREEGQREKAGGGRMVMTGPMRQQTVFILPLRGSAGLSVCAEGENQPKIALPKAISS
jgi:hypothetical protein